jgi:hypothetical protein
MDQSEDERHDNPYDRYRQEKTTEEKTNHGGRSITRDGKTFSTAFNKVMWEEKGASKSVFEAPFWGFGRGKSADAFLKAIVSPKLSPFKISA